MAVVASRTMFSLLAILAVFFGLLLVPVAAPFGAGLVIAGLASALKAMDRGDDMNALFGAAFGIAAVFTVLVFIDFLSPWLELP